MAGHPIKGTACIILSQSLLAPKSSERLVFDLGVGPIIVKYSIIEDL
jgi:hypothetical protein